MEVDRLVNFRGNLMPKQIIIAEQHRIGAVYWEDQIQELVVATGQHQVGDIHLGIVENILQGIDAAFVNIGDGADRNGFIHVTDLGPLRLRRSAGAITDLLSPNQKVLVQIMKEPTGNKGPRLTGNISLPGRYVVLMPFGKGVNLSRRISSESERNRLRAVAILAKPPGMGLLVRTEAEGTPEEAILEDLDRLQKQWEVVQQEANITRAPALLTRDDDFIQRVLRDMYSSDVNRIAIDSAQGVKRVKQFLLNWNNGVIPNNVSIDRHQERLPILEYFRVNSSIREALKPRVDLPSGGYIIIEPTEALTVIDVNSGSFTQSRNSRETVLWTNCEAATEIARQLRLRNVAGVIVVDFIDMDYRKDQIHLLEHFNKQLRADKATPQISQLSELGLVELTRKRQGQNIYELFGRSCQTCGGIGHLVHLPDDEHVSANGQEGVSLASLPAGRDSFTRSSSRYESRQAARSGRSAAANHRWDSFDDGDGSGDREPLDLMNHPNYQERDRFGKKRRRRLGRGERDDASTLRNTPRPITNNNNNTDSHRPVRGEMARGGMARGEIVRGEVERFAEDRFAENRQPSQLEAFGAIDRQPLEIETTERVEPERERPAKPVKPTRAPIEPPEVVSVEMTELEKETYAWMGISPVLKLDRELKNPKTAIVNIVAPGSLPPESAIDSLESFTLPEVDDLPADENSILPSDEIAIQVLPATPQQPQQIDLPFDAPATGTDIDLSPATDGDNDSDDAPNRRRRRRSSSIGE
jgi:ribonuclease E